MKIKRLKLTSCPEFDALEKRIQNSTMSNRFLSCPYVAVIGGPAVVIEAIVRKAERTSGIPMDWHYLGGRGGVCALGDRKIAREALWLAMPRSDLSTEDWNHE